MPFLLLLTTTWVVVLVLPVVQHVFRLLRPSAPLPLQIYLLNPSALNRCKSLLGAGKVGGRPFQPFGAHVPYLLRFLVDNGLYGMNFLNADSFRFRQPMPTRYSTVRNERLVWCCSRARRDVLVDVTRSQYYEGWVAMLGQGMSFQI